MRSGSRCAGGTRYGIPACWIFCLARTSRLAIVGSLARNARAISAVVSPASVRRVSATRASSASAGWQQVNISRSRSSGTPLWSVSGSYAEGSDDGDTDMAATSRSLAAPTAFLRSTSMARLRAAVVSHAPGRPGMPSFGHRCRAIANASCAHSSARSQSPVVRISVATTRPHSSRNAASTAALTSIQSLATSTLPLIDDRKLLVLSQTAPAPWHAHGLTTAQDNVARPR